jgi:hypothetical protein
MNKIIEFLKTLWVLSLVTIKSLWIILKDDMKKESQTYKEEREDKRKREDKERRAEDIRNEMMDRKTNIGKKPKKENYE